MRLVNERKRVQHTAAVRVALDGLYEGGIFDRDVDLGMIAHALHAGILSMATAWRDDADEAERAGLHGHKVRAKMLRDAAAEAAGFGASLIASDFLASITVYADPGSTPDPTAGHDPVVPDIFPCPHPESAVSVLKSGDRKCTQCGEMLLSNPTAPTITEQPSMLDYIAGRTDVMPEPTLSPSTVSFITGTPPDYQGTIPGIPAFTDPPSFGPPERMSWEEFATAAAAIDPADHASFSSITKLADCGMKYALDKIRGERPGWALVGGKAFHKAIEGIERLVIEQPKAWSQMMSNPTPGSIEAVKKMLDDGWLRALTEAIAEQNAETPHISQSDWYVAGKGLENYDWWRVRGLEMLQRYVAYWEPKRNQGWQIFQMPDGRPALELELTLQVGLHAFVAKIDQVWRRPLGGDYGDQLFISDPKSGATCPPTTLQLGGYAHALRAALIEQSPVPAGVSVQNPRIAGGFYRAREGSHDKESDNLFADHPWAEVVHLTNSAMALIGAGAYLPRVSDFGGGCTSCGHKSICPARS